VLLQKRALQKKNVSPGRKEVQRGVAGSPLGGIGKQDDRKKGTPRPQLKKGAISTDLQGVQNSERKDVVGARLAGEKLKKKSALKSWPSNKKKGSVCRWRCEGSEKKKTPSGQVVGKIWRKTAELGDYKKKKGKPVPQPPGRTYLRPNSEKKREPPLSWKLDVSKKLCRRRKPLLGGGTRRTGNRNREKTNPVFPYQGSPSGGSGENRELCSTGSSRGIEVPMKKQGAAKKHRPRG